MSDFDIAIVGAGIAGAGLAAQLAPYHRVLMLEAEAQAGYHSTGRSAAFWDECYGGPLVQPLTTASYAFLESPPADFHDRSLLAPRGVLQIGRDGEESLADAFEREFAGSGVAMERCGHAEMSARVPGLRQDWQVGLWSEACYDIDVASLHGGYLRAARRAGAQLATNAALERARWQDGAWDIETRAGSFRASMLVNAAGAWADDIARRADVSPIGIQPNRRTIVQLVVDPPASSNLPLVIGLDESFYFKPEAGGRLWLSPHDETPCPPCDAAPEELDIAIAIDRLQQAVDWKIEKVEHSWAGLRSFAADRLPVIGADPEMPAFFWLAGQGGFGIQTAPAISALAASLLDDHVSPPPAVEAQRYAPDRLR